MTSYRTLMTLVTGELTSAKVTLINDVILDEELLMVGDTQCDWCNILFCDSVETVVRKRHTEVPVLCIECDPLANEPEPEMG